MPKASSLLLGPLQLVAVASKEVKLIASQRISIALVLLYPALVMISLAFAFGQGAAYAESFGKPAIESLSVAVYLPEASDVFDRQAFLDKISDQNDLQLKFFSSPEQIRVAVAKGQHPVGLLVNPPAEKNGQIRVSVIYDNSALLAGQALSGQAASAVRQVASTTSSEILGDIWKDLDKLQADLDRERGKLTEFTASIGKTREKLDKLSDQFNSIDVSKESDDLNVFDAFYDTSKASSRDSRKSLDDTRIQLVAYRQKVSDAVTAATNSEVAQVRTQQSLSLMLPSTVDPVNAQLQLVIAAMGEQISATNRVAADLQGVIVDIDNTTVKVDEAFASLETSDIELDKAKQGLGGFEESVKSLEKTLAEGKPTMKDAKQSQAEISDDMQKTTTLMNDMLDNVNRFKSYQPGYLVTPVEIEEEEAFPASQLAIVVPVGLSIVLLLTCILLTALSVVLERTAGISSRIAVARVGRGTWLAGKLLGQLLFALVEAAIFLGLAVFVFNVPFTADPLAVVGVVVLMALMFSSIGLFISNFTQTLSTAILGSLLVMIPMLFLSGTMFPFEFMPEGITLICRWLPLTAAKDALLGVMVKGSSLGLLLPQLGLMVGTTLLLTGFSWLKKER